MWRRRNNPSQDAFRRRDRPRHWELWRRLTHDFTLVESAGDLLRHPRFACVRAPASERLHLLEVIWDSLIEVPEAIPVSAEIRAELDRRLEAYLRNPETARPWAEVRDELFRDK